MATRSSAAWRSARWGSWPGRSRRDPAAHRPVPGHRGDQVGRPVRGDGRGRLPKLTELLKHEDPTIRWRATWALGKIHGPSLPAVPEIIRLTGSDPEPLVPRARGRGAGGHRPRPRPRASPRWWRATTRSPRSSAGDRRGRWGRWGRRRRAAPRGRAGGGAGPRPGREDRRGPGGPADRPDAHRQEVSRCGPPRTAAGSLRRGDALDAGADGVAAGGVGRGEGDQEDVYRSRGGRP